MRADGLLSKRMERVTSSATMELIKTTAAGDYISFASGLPDPSLFAVDAIREATERVLARDALAALQYGASEGYMPLREYVAELVTRRGFSVSPEQVLITNGSQQALDLAARALLDPGDTAIVEAPTYLAALQAFDSYGVRYRTVPMDEGGMVVECLAPVLRARPKLLYLLPNYQNPTGFTMAPGRRRAVAEIAAAEGLAVLEDDAYHDLRYDGEPLPPVCGLTENPWAIYTGTFSKTIAPGIRVGYLCAHPDLVSRLVPLKQITDLQAGSLTQRIVLEYCRRGHLEPGIERLRAAYRSRRDTMLAALDEHLSGIATWTRPFGGMFLWVCLPEGLDAGELLRRAMARGVVFVPGASFHADGRGGNAFRLNFVSADEARIREGIAILGEVTREWLR